MTDLNFPSVTICSPGLNMEAVKEAILDDFDKWLNETGGNYKEQLDDFMEEKYAKKVKDRNIFEQIKAMNSPHPPSKDNQECKGCSSGLQTLAACAERNGQHGTTSGSRRKRSSEGKGRFLPTNINVLLEIFKTILCHFQSKL